MTEALIEGVQNMRVPLPHDPDTLQEVSLVDVGGFYDAIIRASSREVWLAAAEREGLMVRDSEDNLIAIPGVWIVEIGPMQLTPPVIDPDTLAVLEWATYDKRHHLNMRVGPRAQKLLNEDGYPRVYEIALAWSTLGAPVTERNAEEEARELGGVELIDATTIRNPHLKFL